MDPIFSLTSWFERLQAIEPKVLSATFVTLSSQVKQRTLVGKIGWKAGQLTKHLVRITSRSHSASREDGNRVLAVFADQNFRKNKCAWIVEFVAEGPLKGSIDGSEASDFLDGFSKKVGSLVSEQTVPTDQDKPETSTSTDPGDESESNGGGLLEGLGYSGLSLLASGLPEAPRARAKRVRLKLREAGLVSELLIFRVKDDGSFSRPWAAPLDFKPNFIAALSDFASKLQGGQVNYLMAKAAVSEPDYLDAKLYVSRHGLDRMDLYLFEYQGAPHALYVENAGDLSNLAIAQLAAIIEPSSSAYDFGSRQALPNRFGWLSRNSWWLVTFVVLLGIALASLTNGPFKISAKAVVKPASSQTISTPFPARLVSINVDRGDRVSEGDLLAVLNSEDMEDQRDQAALEYVLQEVEKRSLQGGEDILGFQVAELKADIALQRKTYFDRQVSMSMVVAPDDGIISDKVTPEALGKNMGRGERLFELQTSDEFVVQLTIRGQDLRYIQKEQTGRVILQGDTERGRGIQILHVPRTYSLTETGDKEFYARARLVSSGTDGISPQKGLLGLAQIDVQGEYKRYWLWSREIRHFIFLKIWQYFGWHPRVESIEESDGTNQLLLQSER